MYRSFNRIPKLAIILTPNTERRLSYEDLEAVTRHGIGAVDCSWATPEFLDKVDAKRGRTLPWLLAGNPVNYSTPGKLTTLEAFAAALWITDFTNEAKQLLGLYKWGATFLTLNLDALEKYAGQDESMIKESEHALLAEQMLS